MGVALVNLRAAAPGQKQRVVLDPLDETLTYKILAAFPRM
jgi:hypothetical protein